MSYSFHLMPPAADGELRAQALQHDEKAFQQIDPKKEALKEQIAAALIARFPTFEASRVGYGAQGASSQRYFELNDMGAESFGVQIELFDDEAFVTAPFWHTGDKARACFRQIWDVMGIVCREAGYAVYDPQMGRALEDRETIDRALRTYLEEMAEVSIDPARGGRKMRKPWWKFW